ncbi:MAG: protein jag [Dehalococcoidales bacterium]|nr:protein jag [Dehalococcoidales bacterium]
MESLEMSGKNVEEAIEKALKTLGVSREEIKVTILREGKSGLFGIGTEEAEILVETTGDSPVSDSKSDAETAARQILEDLLNLMGFQAKVITEESFIVTDDEERIPITFNITDDDDVGILIGRHGQTMSSLQYLVRIMLSHRIENSPPVIVDIDGYKERRYNSLRETAKRLAEQVKTRRTPFTLEPMPAIERRIIHTTLANDPNVITQSTGEGEARKVVISPKNAGRYHRPPPNNR